MHTQGNLILRCKDVIKVDLWNRCSDHVKDIACYLRSGVCEFVEGIKQVLFDDLILYGDHHLQAAKVC